ncbi:hypothetical protein FRC19_003494, partial [Serendipita sp. 401]
TMYNSPLHQIFFRDGLIHYASIMAVRILNIVISNACGISLCRTLLVMGDHMRINDPIVHQPACRSPRDRYLGETGYSNPQSIRITPTFKIKPECQYRQPKNSRHRH